MGTILVVGDIMLDLTFQGTPDRICPEQSHALVHTQDTAPTITLGGAGNVARVLANYNRRVELIGKIGNDAYGVMVLEECRRCGIGASNIVVDDGPTTLKTRVISIDGTHSVLKGRWDWDRSSEDGQDNIIPFDSWDGISCIIYSDYNKGMFPEHFSIRADDILTIGDLKPSTVAQLDSALELDYILPNRKEMNQLNELYVDGNFGKLHVNGGVVVTCSEDGAIWLDENGMATTILPQQEYYGITGDHRSGAGDVFTAVFASHIVDGSSLTAATMRAVEVSSKVAITGKL